MAVSLAFATALFLLLATACSRSGSLPQRTGPHHRARREQPAGPRGTLRVTGGELRGRLRMAGVHGAVGGGSRHCAGCRGHRPGAGGKEWERKRSR